MELRHLRYVLAVADELHFGRAAEKLHISQPPLSQQIQRLEQELGVKLFHRTKRHVQLTEAGQRLANEARRILLQVDHVTRVASRAEQGEIGQLTVGTVLAEKAIVINTLRTFARRHPDVRLELQNLSTGEQIKAINEGRIHVGFVTLPVDAENLAVEVVAKESVVAALPANHRLAQRRRLPLQALAGEPTIFFPRPLSPGHYDEVVSRCRDAGFALNIIHEMGSIYAMMAMVAAGLGISLVPASIQEVERLGIVFRDVEPGIRLKCAIVYRHDMRSVLIESFLDIARQSSQKSRNEVTHGRY